jgi:hypothetical protein
MTTKKEDGRTDRQIVLDGLEERKAKRESTVTLTLSEKDARRVQYVLDHWLGGAKDLIHNDETEDSIRFVAGFLARALPEES